MSLYHLMYLMLWPPLSFTFEEPQKNLMTAASTLLHTARTIYKHLQPWHFLSPVLHLCGFFVRDLREVLSLCLVPPACTSAIGITLKNAFDKCIADAAFCCQTGAACMDVWPDKPTLATLSGSKHWSFTEAATNMPTSCIEDVIYVTCWPIQGPTALFFLQYLDNCECIDIISPACCVFSLCYLFSRGGKLTEWSLVLGLTFLSPSLSLSFQVGPDGGLGGRTDMRLRL